MIEICHLRKGACGRECMYKHACEHVHFWTCASAPRAFFTRAPWVSVLNSLSAIGSGGSLTCVQACMRSLLSCMPSLCLRAHWTCVHLESACILNVRAPWACVLGLPYCVRVRGIYCVFLYTGTQCTYVCVTFCVTGSWCDMGMCEGLSEAWRPSCKWYFLWKNTRGGSW